MRANLCKQELHHGRVPLGRREVQRRSPTIKPQQYIDAHCGVLGILHSPFCIDRVELSTVAHIARLRTVTIILRACVPAHATVDVGACACETLDSRRARSRELSPGTVRRAAASVQRQVLRVLVRGESTHTGQRTRAMVQMSPLSAALKSCAAQRVRSAADDGALCS